MNAPRAHHPGPRGETGGRRRIRQRTFSAGILRGAPQEVPPWELSTDILLRRPGDQPLFQVLRFQPRVAFTRVTVTATTAGAHDEEIAFLQLQPRL